jgi:hypothetical protein
MRSLPQIDQLNYPVCYDRSIRKASMQALKSEDDVRTKVVVPWLLSHGFSLSTISIEFSFRIRLGRSVMQVGRGAKSREDACSIYSPRADVLVRNDRGDNLLIIEVKAPSEALDDAARDQGISYARCVAEGNIAPFVVVTNGLRAHVYDSISRLEVEEDLQLSTACATRALHVSPDELTLRAEALEALISFSQENLMAFCEAQTRFRMRPLLGEKLDSDKKYIPSLFVQREELTSLLSDALDVKRHRVTLLIGYPQVGKTNFVCHTVMERISHDQPCLFYPAISLQRPLLAEIGDDLEWGFSGTQETASQLVRKLNRVLQRAQKRLTIFVDGLNETTVKLARAIDADCERISGDRIQIVISLTHSSATRLLRDAAGNSSFIAGEAGIPSYGASLIELDPEAAARISDWNCIHVKRYSKEECDKAYDVYSIAYEVDLPQYHAKTQDPYVLGIAMKQFVGQRLPDCLDEPSLLHSFIANKIRRSVGLDDYNVLVCLRELGREIIRRGTAVPIETICKIWSRPTTQNIPSGFFESALLIAETDENGQQSVDFYFGRERDYVIACLTYEWPKKLRNLNDLDAEFSEAIGTTAGSDAIAWLLRQPTYNSLLKEQPGGIPRYSHPRVRQTLLASLCEYTAANGMGDEEWLRFAIDSAMNDPDHRARIEAVKLIALGSDESDDLSSALASEASLSEFIETILGIGEEFPFKLEDTGRIVLDALRSLHWDMCDHDEGTSEISDILARLSENPSPAIRREANTCLGYIAPFEFIKNLSNQINRSSPHIHQENIAEFSEAIKNAANALGDGYYGDMCPGALESILEDSEYQSAEYKKMRTHLEPIIYVFRGIDGTDLFESILESLCCGLDDSAKGDNKNVYTDMYTLPLPFGETDGLIELQRPR